MKPVLDSRSVNLLFSTMKNPDKVRNIAYFGVISRGVRLHLNVHLTVDAEVNAFTGCDKKRL